MLTMVSRILLLLSAFAPLFFIWGLKAWPGRIAWFFFALVVIGAGGTVLVVIAARRDEGESVHLRTVEDRQSDVAAYLVTYLVPFATASVTSIQDTIAICVFLALLLVLYLTTDLISVNPLLALFELRLYKVEFDDARKVWLLAAHPQAGSDLDVVRIFGSVYVEIGEP